MSKDDDLMWTNPKIYFKDFFDKHNVKARFEYISYDAEVSEQTVVLTCTGTLENIFFGLSSIPNALAFRITKNIFSKDQMTIEITFDILDKEKESYE